MTNPIEKHYSLKEAAEFFFPGTLTLKSLRTEIKKGRLRATRVAGKDLVTARDIGEMLRLCRGDQKGQGSTLDGGKAQSHTGLSETDATKNSQDAAKETIKKLRENLPSTLQKNTNRRRRNASSQSSASQT